MRFFVLVALLSLQSCYATLSQLLASPSVLLQRQVYNLDANVDVPTSSLLQGNGATINMGNFHIHVNGSLTWTNVTIVGISAGITADSVLLSSVSVLNSTASGTAISAKGDFTVSNCLFSGSPVVYTLLSGADFAVETSTFSGTNAITLISASGSVLLSNTLFNAISGMTTIQIDAANNVSLINVELNQINAYQFVRCNSFSGSSVSISNSHFKLGQAQSGRLEYAVISSTSFFGSFFSFTDLFQIQQTIVEDCTGDFLSQSSSTASVRMQYISFDKYSAGSISKSNNFDAQYVNITNSIASTPFVYATGRATIFYVYIFNTSSPDNSIAFYAPTPNYDTTINFAAVFADGNRFGANSFLFDFGASSSVSVASAQLDNGIKCTGGDFTNIIFTYCSEDCIAMGLGVVSVDSTTFSGAVNAAISLQGAIGLGGLLFMSSVEFVQLGPDAPAIYDNTGTAGYPFSAVGLFVNFESNWSNRPLVNVNEFNCSYCQFKNSATLGVSPSYMVAANRMTLYQVLVSNVSAPVIFAAGQVDANTVGILNVTADNGFHLWSGGPVSDSTISCALFTHFKAFTTTSTAIDSQVTLFTEDMHFYDLGLALAIGSTASATLNNYTFACLAAPATSGTVNATNEFAIPLPADAASCSLSQKSGVIDLFTFQCNVAPTYVLPNITIPTGVTGTGTGTGTGTATGTDTGTNSGSNNTASSNSGTSNTESNSGTSTNTASSTNSGPTNTGSNTNTVSTNSNTGSNTGTSNSASSGGSSASGSGSGSGSGSDDVPSDPAPRLSLFFF